MNYFNPLVKTLPLVEISSARLYPLEELGYPIITVDELISRLLDTKEDSLLCGSLYYVGEVLEKWGMFDTPYFSTYN